MEQDVAPEGELQKFISGKQGARYVNHCAFSIQPQNYPNAINYVSSSKAIKILQDYVSYYIQVNFLLVAFSLFYFTTRRCLLSWFNL